MIIVTDKQEMFSDNWQSHCLAANYLHHNDDGAKSEPGCAKSIPAYKALTEGHKTELDSQTYRPHLCLTTMSIQLPATRSPINRPSNGTVLRAHLTTPIGRIITIDDDDDDIENRPAGPSNSRNDNEVIVLDDADAPVVTKKRKLAPSPLIVESTASRLKKDLARKEEVCRGLPSDYMLSLITLEQQLSAMTEAQIRSREEISVLTLQLEAAQENIERMMNERPHPDLGTCEICTYKMLAPYV